MMTLSVSLAVANFCVWLVIFGVAIGEWRRFHDERAARGILLALVLVAASVGGVGSSVANYAASRGEDFAAAAAIAAIARGAMVVGGIAYLASLWHRSKRNGR